MPLGLHGETVFRLYDTFGSGQLPGSGDGGPGGTVGEGGDCAHASCENGYECVNNSSGQACRQAYVVAPGRLAPRPKSG